MKEIIIKDKNTIEQIPVKTNWNEIKVKTDWSK